MTFLSEALTFSIICPKLGQGGDVAEEGLVLVSRVEHLAQDSATLGGGASLLPQLLQQTLKDDSLPNPRVTCNRLNL